MIIVTVLFHLMFPQAKGYLITGTIFSLSERSLAQEKAHEGWATRVGYFLRKGLIMYDFMFYPQLEHAHIQLIAPLEKFRKSQIGSAKVFFFLYQ